MTRTTRLQLVAASLLLTAAALEGCATRPQALSANQAATDSPTSAPATEAFTPATHPGGTTRVVVDFTTYIFDTDKRQFPRIKDYLAHMKFFEDDATMFKQFDRLRSIPGLKNIEITNARAAGDTALVLTNNSYAAGPHDPILFTLHKKEGHWFITSVDILSPDQARDQLEAFIRKSIPADTSPTTAADLAPFDPLVSDLLIPARRDAAARKILFRWQADHVEFLDKIGVPPVRNVVVCPQPKGPPLFLLFLTANINTDGERSIGSSALLNSQGTFIQWTFPTREESLLDINDDGILDRVSTTHLDLGGGPRGVVDVIEVVPFTLDPKPALRIACNPHLQIGDEQARAAAWTWELHSTGSPNILSLNIGPRDPKTHIVTPKATYTWDPQTKTYTGPAGSKDETFLRILQDGYPKELFRFMDLNPPAKAD